MKERGKRKKYIPLILGEIAALLFIAYVILCFEADSEHILPRTVVNGKDLGGMTWEEASAKLDKDADSRKNEAVIRVDFDGEIYTVAAGNAMEFDGDALAREILARSKSSFWKGGILYLGALLRGYEIEVLPEIKSMDALYKEIEASGLLEVDDSVQTSYRREGKQLIFQIGTAGEAVDAKKLAEEILEAVRAENYQDIIECPKVPIFLLST